MPDRREAMRKFTQAPRSLTEWLNSQVRSRLGADDGGNSTGMQLTIPLPHTARAAAAARKAVRDAVEKWDVPAPLDDLLLVVSELVTNAFRYGQDPVALHLTVADGYVIIAVTDGDASSLPFPRQPSESEDHGRGLRLIAATATHWGWEQLDDDHNKMVWAQIPLAKSA